MPGQPCVSKVRSAASVSCMLGKVEEGSSLKNTLPAMTLSGAFLFGLRPRRKVKGPKVKWPLLMDNEAAVHKSSLM